VSTTVTRLAARMANISYSFTAHAKDIFHETVDNDQLANKLADAAAVVTVSDFNVRHLKSRHGGAAHRVRCIYNGLDLDAFPYRSPEVRPRRIVAVGRLVEKKGFDDLIEACALLVEEEIDFDCQIIGTGDQHDPLQAEIADLGLTDRVQLIGARPQAEVIAAIQQASVLAAPCVVGADGNRDGMPTVLLESMALGTPTVATSVTGIPELVRDGETGCLVPEREPRALATALRRLLDDGPLRVQLARNGRRLIEHSFDVHRSAACLRDIFRTAVPACRLRSASSFEEAPS
ncbi:MAG: glycosyltransferase family 4 protein, partial [Pirellulales bacterium]